MPTYHEVISTGLSAFTKAAERWDGMAEESGMVERQYRRDVHGISLGGSRSGFARHHVTAHRYMRRSATAWAAGSVLLLTACGASADGNEARALTGDDIRAVLPDREALPGWREFGEPLVLEDRTTFQHRACPTEGFQGCEGARSFGLAQFRSGDDRKALVGYQITAYRDEQAAATAYDVLWKGHYRRAGGPDARKLDVGKPGDERNARLGTAGSGGPGALVQLRVGTALMVIDVSGIRGSELDAALVKDLTGVISERAQQALNGEDPTGRLDE